MGLIRDPPHTLLTRLYNISRLSITAALPHLNKLPRSVRAGISLWVVYIAVDGARELLFRRTTVGFLPNVRQNRLSGTI